MASKLRLDDLHSNTKTLQLTLTGPIPWTFTYENGEKTYTLYR